MLNHKTLAIGKVTCIKKTKIKNKKNRSLYQHNFHNYYFLLKQLSPLLCLEKLTYRYPFYSSFYMKQLLNQKPWRLNVEIL